VETLPRRPTPKNDSDFWPIRAADALAWNTHREFIRQQKGKQFSNPLWNLLKSGVVFFDRTYSADNVRDIFMPDEIRQGLYDERMRIESEKEKNNMKG
jgi:hypothetical protein